MTDNLKSRDASASKNLPNVQNQVVRGGQRRFEQLQISSSDGEHEGDGRVGEGEAKG